MAPPLPPCMVDMRFTASRAHRKAADGVHLEDAPQILGLELFEPAALADDAGVVDQGVEPAEALVGLGEQPQHVGLFGNVAAKRQRAAARRFDLADDGFGRLPAGGIIDHHPASHRAAASRAIAAPMPRPAPVTMTTFFAISLHGSE